jgi:hypothetical protein
MNNTEIKIMLFILLLFYFSFYLHQLKSKNYINIGAKIKGIFCFFSLESDLLLYLKKEV